MISACGVDDDSVRWIGGDDRGEALQHPERQPLQRFGVCGRIGVLDHQALHQRLGLARGHADAQAGGLGCGVRRQHDPPSPIPAHQDERRLRRRRCIARLPPDPIGGQGRQEDGDDPWHRTPPIRNLRSRRRGSGSVPPASAGGRHPGRGVESTAAPRLASGWWRLSAGRNRMPRSAASNDEARCRSSPTLRRRVGSRREAVMGRRATSATTAPRPPCRRPSSKQARMVFSSPPSR